MGLYVGRSPATERTPSHGPDGAQGPLPHAAPEQTVITDRVPTALRDNDTGRSLLVDKGPAIQPLHGNGAPPSALRALRLREGKGSVTHAMPHAVPRGGGSTRPSKETRWAPPYALCPSRLSYGGMEGGAQAPMASSRWLFPLPPRSKIFLQTT